MSNSLRWFFSWDCYRSILEILASFFFFPINRSIYLFMFNVYVSTITNQYHPYLRPAGKVDELDRALYRSPFEVWILAPQDAAGHHQDAIILLMVQKSGIQLTSWGNGSFISFCSGFYHHPGWLALGFLNHQQYVYIYICACVCV